MGRMKFLKAESLVEWLRDLNKDRTVFAPRREEGKIVFRPMGADEEPVVFADATTSPKGIFFPPSQELFRYEQSKNPDDPENRSLRLVPNTNMAPSLVFGARPCGARGFTIFDRVYGGAKFPDPYYLAARENTVFVTVTCARAENTCFCNWVGGGPDDPAGSDVLVTQVGGGYVLEAVSERGETLLESSLLNEDAGKAEEALFARARARSTLVPAPDISSAPESLMDLFDDLSFWEEVSAKCLSCGACTYLCPTCYCFTITDEARGLAGKRLRSWDNCMSFQFSLEASGHNPRPTKAHRLKNRVGHKFSYYPSLHGGLIACCGCGRCIRSCPVSLDIREIVLKAVERAKNNVNEVSNG